jgi:hypothetical protein
MPASRDAPSIGPPRAAAETKPARAQPFRGRDSAGCRRVAGYLHIAALWHAPRAPEDFGIATDATPTAKNHLARCPERPAFQKATAA